MKKIETVTVKGFNNYEINTNGEVFNKKSGRKLKPALCGGKTCGEYETVGLRRNNTTTRLYIHRLIFSHFKEELKEGFIIDHKNNNKTDNSVNNLQQIKQRLNTTKDRFRGDYTSNNVGVCRYNRNGNIFFRAMIQINGKNRHLGIFETDYEAAIFYNTASNNIDKFITNQQFRELLQKIIK